ncbi:MAG: response regulator [Wenzhouxiangella sp.]|nr:response regulator [Wenzhouxiangella sp.]MCH8478009.1 response regulator [Wenzhouxiangella sp.]TVR97596.1 MAG: response regulator [Wenzhouxiangellaceae bacterium]
MDSPSDQSSLADLAILVVDDHEINREFLSTGLARLAGNVSLAANGAEAIALCQSTDFDVILLDLHMPRMDGLATANRIRDLDSASAAARMIILTADTRPEERNRLLNAGIDAYLNKPITLPDLVSAINDLLQPGSRHRSGRLVDEQQSRLLDHKRALDAANHDADLARRLTAMLVEELQSGLPRLDEMMRQGQFDQASALLHQWAGAAGYAGAIRFGGSCRSLRRCLDSGLDSSPGTGYLDFLRVARATEQALQERL